MPTTDRVQRGLRTGLLLHEDDLAVSWITQDLKPDATIVLAPQTQVGPLCSAPRVSTFRSAAQNDAISRYGERLGDISHAQTAQDVLDNAATHGLGQLVTVYVPTGPVSDVLAKLESTCQDVPLRRVLSRYDALSWHYATKGFFAFKKQIPHFLNSIVRSL
ncbi:MAG: hypothetical protein AAGI36_09990 [Pseudomonadota bacterium]